MVLQKGNFKQTGIITVSNRLETKSIQKTPHCQTNCKNIKRTSNERINLKWEILRQAAPSSNISKSCPLCLHEKLPISLYPELDELLNKRTKMISKCGQQNKFLLMNFNSTN